MNKNKPQDTYEDIMLRIKKVTDAYLKDKEHKRLKEQEKNKKYASIERARLGLGRTN